MAVAVPSILIVDDDVAVRRLLRVITERFGINADEAATGIECLDLLHRKVYDVLLLDVAMPSANSSEILDYVRRMSNAPALVILTALTRWSLVGVDPANVHCVLRKPFDPDLVAALIVSTATTMHERRMRHSRPAIDVRVDVLQP